MGFNFLGGLYYDIIFFNVERFYLFILKFVEV